MAQGRPCDLLHYRKLLMRLAYSQRLPWQFQEVRENRLIDHRGSGQRQSGTIGLEALLYRWALLHHNGHHK